MSTHTASGQEGKIVPEKKIEGHKVVRLHYMGGVRPETVTVKAGTTVIWVNESKSLVEIEFANKKVTMACKNPVHFVVAEDGTFVSDRIPWGAVASLCFVEAGEFDYIVKRAPRRTAPTQAPLQPFKGKVIVE
jgi:plastocyanin